MNSPSVLTHTGVLDFVNAPLFRWKYLLDKDIEVLSLSCFRRNLQKVGFLFGWCPVQGAIHLKSCFWNWSAQVVRKIELQLWPIETHQIFIDVHGILGEIFQPPNLLCYRMKLADGENPPVSWLSRLPLENTFPSIRLIYGCFLKWWYPQNTPKWSFLVGKPMVVGYHHFRKPPYKGISNH